MLGILAVGDHPTDFMQTYGPMQLGALHGITEMPGCRQLFHEMLCNAFRAGCCNMFGKTADYPWRLPARCTIYQSRSTGKHTTSRRMGTPC